LFIVNLNLERWVRTKTYNYLKKISSKFLPDFLLKSIKKKHYLKILRNINLDDEKDLNVVKYLTSNGDLVIDVGANIGIYTMFLSRFVGDFGTVISIEPICATFNFLVNNIHNLELKNVVPYNIAAGYDESVYTMTIPVGSSGENFYRAKVINDKATEEKVKSKKIKVKSIRLDKLLVKDIDKISFIKIDVEGFEYYVLKGSEVLIKSSRPAMLIEVDGDASDKESKGFPVFDYLKGFGYQPFIYKNHNLKKWEIGDSSVNYFFLNADHLEKIKSKNPTLIV
jgi:FkbM family methyltransferase